MNLKYLFSIIGFTAFNVFQSSAQSPFKAASPGVYPAINQLPRQHKPPMPNPHIPVNGNVGARKTKLSPLTMEVHASYSEADSSYEANDSSLYIYSGGRGWGAKSGTYLFDKGYSWVYVPYLRSLRYSGKSLQTYDASNNVLTSLDQEWDTTTNSWKTYGRLVNTYDAMNNLIADTNQSWDSSSSTWSDDYRNTYTYDASGNMLTAKVESWDGGSSAWVNFSLVIYTYDSHNNLLTDTEQSGNKTTWVNYEQTAYTYDASNNRTSKTFQTWDGSTWQNNSKSLFTYSSTNKVLSEVDQYWDTSSWINLAKTTYTYNASDDPIIVLSQNWNGKSWQNFGQDLQSFNSTHDDTDMLFQSWDTTKSFWYNTDEHKITYDANHDYLTYIPIIWTNASSFIYLPRYSYTYNSNYQILTETEDEWNILGGYWNPADKDFQNRYYYDSGIYYDTSTMVNNINNGGTIKVYPIPANDIMNIDLNWDTPQSAVATICNMQGMLCRQWQIPASSSAYHSVPVAQLPAGSYILKITGEKGQLTQRISIIH